VRIKVLRADIETSKIDFSLVELDSSAHDMQRAFEQSAPKKTSSKPRMAKPNPVARSNEREAAEKLIYGFHPVLARLRQDPRAYLKSTGSDPA